MSEDRPRYDYLKVIKSNQKAVDKFDKSLGDERTQMDAAKDPSRVDRGSS